MGVWNIEKCKLPLKIDWAISRSSTKEKENFIISYKDGGFEGLGEVAFSNRYGENADLILKQFNEFVERCPKNLVLKEGLFQALDSSPIANSLRFGVESAYFDFLSKLSEQSIQELLGINTIRQVETSYSLPILPVGKVGAFINDNHLQRFSVLKMKVDHENAVDLCLEVSKHYQGPLRIDANEAFKSVDDVLKFLEKVGGLPIQFLEQPLPASEYEMALELKKYCNTPLMADESLTSNSVTQGIAERFDAVNIKLMKAGGYFKALQQAREAKQLGLKTMIGCMIETGLGIRSALFLGQAMDYYDLDGFLFLKKDPYPLVYEEKGKLNFSDLH
jgi:L-Ala-D/L-Glu epimerase